MGKRSWCSSDWKRKGTGGLKEEKGEGAIMGQKGKLKG